MGMWWCWCPSHRPDIEKHWGIYCSHYRCAIMTWDFYLFEIIGTWRVQVQVVVASSEKHSVKPVHSMTRSWVEVSSWCLEDSQVPAVLRSWLADWVQEAANCHRAKGAVHQMVPELQVFGFKIGCELPRKKKYGWLVHFPYPICSMYGILTCIYPKNHPVL